MKGVRHTPDWNLSEQPLHEKWPEITPVTLWYMHLTLPGYEGGDCLAKEEPRLLALFSGWWNVLLQGSSPLAFPLHFEVFKEWPQQSRWTLQNLLNEYLFFITSTLILERDSPFQHVWMSQNCSTAYPRTGGCIQFTRDATLLYFAFLTCVSGHIKQTHIIGKCIPQPVLETHVRNYGSSKPTSTYIKIHLRTQETPWCWLADHFWANQPFLSTLLGHNEMLRFSGHFCFRLFCRTFKW